MVSDSELTDRSGLLPYPTERFVGVLDVLALEHRERNLRRDDDVIKIS